MVDLKQIHHDYVSTLKKFVDIYPGNRQKLTEELQWSFEANMILMIWLAVDAPVSEGLAAVNELYYGGANHKQMLQTTYMEFFQKFKGRPVTLIEPDCFDAIIKEDVRNGTFYSRLLAQTIGEVLSNFERIIDDLPQSVVKRAESLHINLHTSLCVKCNQNNIPVPGYQLKTINVSLEQIHDDYNRTLGRFMENYPGDKASITRSLDINLRTGMIQMIWLLNDDPGNESEGISAINQIYYGKVGYYPTSREKYYEGVLNKFKGRYVQPSEPKCFENIMQEDLKNGTAYSRHLAMTIGDVLDNFYHYREKSYTHEQALKVRAMRDTLVRNLIKKCDDNGISVKITIKLQNMSQEEPKKEEIKTDFDELDSLVGLNNVKKKIKEISNFAKIQALKKSKGMGMATVSYNMVFTGNPGTGKTTVARIVASIFKELGLLSVGELVEVSAVDLIAGFVGQTAEKTRAVLNDALGSVLFIDEAYSLMTEGNQMYGQEAISTILKFMEDNRDDFIVIVAGYDEPIRKFIDSNPGLQSRFQHYIHFDDYSPDELFEVFKIFCNEGNYIISKRAETEIREYLKDLVDNKDENFGNSRTIRNYYESVITKQASRLSEMANLTENDLAYIIYDDVKWVRRKDEDGLTVEMAMAELQKLIGLERVKSEIDDLVSLVQFNEMRRNQGLSESRPSLHLAFIGNPGTGKTTVARYIGKIYKAMGLLSKGQLIETNRAGLVGRYLGETAKITQEVIDSAIGGVLFIDEAYTLASDIKGDYGREAIDTILIAMENNRDNLVVIVAGYDNLMEKFFESNPGLKSRVNTKIHFDDYTTDELCEIFISMCEAKQFKVTDGAMAKLRKLFDNVNRAEFGNGRGVRNIFERVTKNQAKRIVANKTQQTADLSLIIEEDVDKI